MGRMWTSRSDGAGLRAACCVLGRVVLAILLAAPAFAQTLNLPPRPAGAPTGTQFTNIILNTSSPTASNTERENWIYAQVISGNVPGWFRTLKPITVTAPGHTATYYVTPDYLAIGSDENNMLMPTTPLVAQRLADRLGLALPTRKMVGAIWTNAAVKIQPITYDPTFYDILSLEVYGAENATVRASRNLQTNAQPLGALVGGDKKDVIISSLIYSNLSGGVPKPVVIYGWHRVNAPNYGIPIQGAVNVHEETYADYSHGARFVQMDLTVDGSANTVTNVLTSATLAPLLSDETIASNNRIPLPRYTVAPMAPTVITHPRSQTVLRGSNAMLSVLPVGDLPLSYRWLLNGATIPSATNSTLTLSNLQPANAGSYSVVVTNATGGATSRLAVVRVRTTDFPQLFVDNFETNTAANWDLFWGAGNAIADYTVDWAYDYGVIPYTFNGVIALIPPAPNSPDGSSRGVRLTVNNNDATGAAAAVNIYSKNFTATGNYALKFDLWLQYPGGASGIGTGVTGSTQHATMGLNHLGTNVNWHATSAPASDGIWFAADGEGGETVNHRDYRAYVGNLGGTQTELIGAAASGLSASNNTAGLFPSLFPNSRFETAGAPGKNWIEVELRQTNNVVVWLLDGTVVALRTNTSGFKSGKIMLGLMDLFASIASPERDSFVLFDNVRVENLAPPIRFQSATRLPNGNVSLVITSALGDNFSLEASTNFTVWQPLANLTVTNNPLSFTDTTAGSLVQRFYRARR